MYSTEYCRATSTVTPSCFAFDVENVGVDRFARAVEVLHVLAEAVVVLVRFFFAGALVGDGDADALVEEGELLHALLTAWRRRYFVFGKICGSGFECGFRAAFGGVADAADVGLGDAAFVLLVIDLAVAADFDFAPFGEEVDDRDADAVETAGGLVGAFFELAAEFEDGHHAFERGHIAAGFFGKLGVALDGDAAAVVFDRDAAVDVDRDADRGGVAGHRFVDRVVDDFVDEVMEAALGGIADVHRGRSRTCSRSLRCWRSSDEYWPASRGAAGFFSDFSFSGSSAILLVCALLW